MDLEKLTQIIRHKSKSLPEGVNIISPEELPSETKADWLITLLSRMYVEHGITKHRDQLVVDIDSGNCRIWFATKDNLPIGSAAQVKQSDQAVEIGRAVSLTNGVGGLLMLLAASDHFSRSDQPLVAEVRIADDFMGIPSGEATQVICFKHLAMIPHACIPASNHGNPTARKCLSSPLLSRSLTANRLSCRINNLYLASWPQLRLNLLPAASTLNLLSAPPLIPNLTAEAGK